MKRKLLLAFVALAALALGLAGTAFAENNAGGSVGTVQIGNTAVDPTASASTPAISATATATVPATTVAASAPVSIGGSGNNTASNSVGTVQAGGGNTAHKSAGTAQSGPVSIAPTVSARAGRHQASATAPLTIGRDGGNSASQSLGTAQVGGGSTTRRSTGTAQTAAVQASPTAGTNTVGARVLAAVSGVFGGGRNSADSSAATVQLGGGNNSRNSVGGAQAAGPTANAALGVDTPVRALAGAALRSLRGNGASSGTLRQPAGETRSTTAASAGTPPVAAQRATRGVVGATGRANGGPIRGAFGVNTLLRGTARLAQLPFTGLALWMVTLAGLVLLASGLQLRARACNKRIGT